jgi:hypothetical protein
MQWGTRNDGTLVGAKSSRRYSPADLEMDALNGICICDHLGIC